MSEKDGFEKYKYPVEMYYVVGTSVEKYEKEFSNRWLVLIQEAVARWNKQDIIIHLALSEEEYADLKDKNSKIIIHHLKLCKDGDPTKLGYNNALGTGTGADRQISIFMEHIEDLANEAFPASDEYDETTREAYINHVFLFTVLHELGHSFGLDDVGYDFGTYPSIMKSKKNEWNYYNDVYGKAVPQLVDFVGAHHQQIQNQSS